MTPPCLPLNVLDRLVANLLNKHQYILQPDPGDISPHLSPAQQCFINDCGFYTQDALDKGREMDFIGEVVYRFFLHWQYGNAQLWSVRNKLNEKLEIIIPSLNRAFFECQNMLPEISWQILLSCDWKQWDKLLSPLRTQFLKSPPVPLPLHHGTSTNGTNNTNANSANANDANANDNDNKSAAGTDTEDSDMTDMTG
ncbi:hypothetical protein FA15DRAFT_709871 [Coprinopsis marcescibilis]|uniref:Uncharacterized protein n=1 Tax=Coprinopsis marcescibilis TaxID=230819 RepID=A0A5C3KFB0_COPMA|nr:hypothetical protein FA15DRAFT_709871 [Coprinopsis marcescibilis]